MEISTRSDMASDVDPTGFYGRPLLGTILSERFNLSEEKLVEALSLQQSKGGRLGDTLMRLRAIQEEELLQALAYQLELPWMPQLEMTRIDQTFVKKVPIAFPRRYRVLPLWMDEGSVVVATTDPMETAAFDDLRLLLGVPVKPVLTTGVALLACLNQIYDQASSPTASDQVLEDIAASDNLGHLTLQLDEPQDLLDATDEAPIIRLVNS